ncbi:flagellin [Tibeticola sp.]|uniref:flagellin N-terminal helical domain-containing protein n=1 Tax=Tibeticola sp. TaxID=2005368 RepID=UPI002589C4BC|nr:flagellin [Tibeticola sp.]MCI4441266.1 flagellar protein FlaB [Tibeticola sp.]
MAISGIINTNVNALNTLNALGGTAGSLSKYVDQLSSGKKINGPADDPAGYAISQRFQTQINGLNQAVSNGNQAVSLVQTATGALKNETNLLQQIRTIAVQSANGSNTSSDRAALQGVVSQLLAQVRTIATQTQFNGQNLLDGSFAGQQFQVGANANQIINVSVANANTDAIGNNVMKTSGAIYTTNGSVVDDGYAAGGAFTISQSAGNFTSGAVTINGYKGSDTVTVANATDSAASIAASVNKVSEKTGVTATANTSVAFAVTSGSFSLTLGNGTTGSQTNAVNISANVTSIDPTGLSGLVSAINDKTATTGITASLDANNKLILTQSQGENISIAGFSGTGSLVAGGVTIDGSTGKTTGLVQGFVQLQSTQGYSLGNGGNIGLDAISTLSAVASVDVSTVQGANKAIAIVDQAINALNKQGGDLGAIQNRVQASVKNLQTTAVNLQAAQSVVQDANIAEATTELSKYQILQQAGISTLAQANSLQQSFLKLLP